MPTLLNPGALVRPAGHEKDVPLRFIMNHIAGAATGERLMFLQAKTASGKSTTIPPVLYTELILGKRKFCNPSKLDGRKVICTQPRIITATEIPQTIIKGAYYHQFQMGVDMGYQTKVASERIVKKGVLFVVLQVLSTKLATYTDEQIMKEYGFIVIDEAHERSIALDNLLFQLKMFLLRNRENPRCPYVIVMSATFDPDKYQKYFGFGDIVEVSGQSYPIEMMWPEKGVSNYVSAAADKVKEIIRNKSAAWQGDILIFFAGTPEAKKVKATLEAELDKDTEVLTVSGEGIKAADINYRMLVSARDPRVKRRIIVGTAALETGITIPNLKHVIDCGWSKQAEYNPWHDVNGLLQKPAAKSAILQRRGRTGRENAGFFHPLYKEETYNQLINIQYPDILREDAAQTVLLGFASEREEMDFLDNPTGQGYNRAVHKLLTLGFLMREAQSGKLTISSLGRIAIKLINSCSIESIKMIFSGFAWGVCIYDLITIAAGNTILESRMMSRKFKFESWRELVNLAFGVSPDSKAGEDTVYYYKLIFGDDFINNIIIYEAFMKKLRLVDYDLIKLREWCDEIKLKYDTIVEFIATRENIEDTCLLAGLNPYVNFDRRFVDIFHGGPTECKNIDDILLYKQCIKEGYKNNLATWSGSYYETMSGLRIQWYFYGNYKKNWNIWKEKEPVIPQHIIYSSLDMRFDDEMNIYKISPDRISILDGYLGAN